MLKSLFQVKIRPSAWEGLIHYNWILLYAQRVGAHRSMIWTSILAAPFLKAASASWAAAGCTHNHRCLLTASCGPAEDLNTSLLLGGHLEIHCPVIYIGFRGLDPDIHREAIALNLGDIIPSAMARELQMTWGWFLHKQRTSRLGVKWDWLSPWDVWLTRIWLI